jgi:ABC-type glycerol-3-phosphate transport system substrate-binding protein
MAENPGVNIIIIPVHMGWEGDPFYEETKRQFSERVHWEPAPVMTGIDCVDWQDPQVTQTLLDLYPLMATDPEWRDEDWFMNIFHSMSDDGRLYAFPTSFYYSLLTVNNMIPGLSEAFEGAEGVTDAELLDIHREMSESSELLFMPDFDVTAIMDSSFDSFLDIKTGRVDFDNERFIELIEHSRNVTEPGKEFGIVIYSDDPTAIIDLEHYARSYLFRSTGPCDWNYTHFLDYEADLPFSGLIPIVNGRGELIAYPGSGFVISTFATPIQQALAWDFLKFMCDPANILQPITDPDRIIPQRYPVSMQTTNREQLRSIIEWDLIEMPDIIRGFNNIGWTVAGSDEELVESVIDKMTAFSEMPMAAQTDTSYDFIFGMDGVIQTVLREFHYGRITAEEAARELQEQVTAALVESGVAN